VLDELAIRHVTETDKSITQLTIVAAFYLQVVQILKSPKTETEMHQTLVPQKH
jgi:hypothetical protein